MPLTGCDAHHERLQSAQSLMRCEDAVTAIMTSGRQSVTLQQLQVQCSPVERHHFWNLRCRDTDH